MDYQRLLLALLLSACLALSACASGTEDLSGEEGWEESPSSSSTAQRQSSSSAVEEEETVEAPVEDPVEDGATQREEDAPDEIDIAPEDAVADVDNAAMPEWEGNREDRVSTEGIRDYDNPNIQPRNGHLVWFEIDPENTTDEKLATIFYNDSNRVIHYEALYVVEVYNAPNWERVPIEFDINDYAATLEPGDARPFDFYLYPEQYDYQPGLYRIRKNVTDGELFVVFLPFTIQ